MQVEILGTVQIRRDGRVTEIPSLRQRAALGLLAIEVGRFVSTYRLVDAVWGTRLPRHPEAALRTVLSRLRVLLDPVGIEHGPAGYRLDLAAEAVDAVRFSQPVDRPDALASLLDLWRGDPIPELSEWDEWIFYIEPLRLRRAALAARLDRARLGDSVAREAQRELVGRDEDINRLSAVVGDGQLHTVVGPPGIGKSSLVRSIAARSRLPAKLVDLAGASSDDEMMSRIAGTIGVVDMTAAPLVLGVIRRLESAGSNLLVLDDCDGLAETAAVFVSEVRRRCPLTHLLVSARGPLTIQGEVVHHLSELSRDDAEELMRQRIGEPATDERSSTAIDLLVEHTSGVPLAIELAAAEAALLGLREAAELYAAGGTRDADSVISASVERSIRSLPDQARTLLLRLTALDGPFSIGCAAHVGDMELHDCARSLGVLTAHSMLSRRNSHDHVDYWLLPPLRRAVSAMASASDREEAHRGLRSHAMALARRISVERVGQRGPECRRLLRHERSALRTAMRVAIESGDAECAVLVTGSLLEQGFRRVDRELFDWAEAATALPDADRQPDVVRAHALAAYGSWYRASREGVARHLASIDRCEEGLDSQRASGFSSALGAVIATFFDNDPGAALQWIAAAQMPDPWWRLYHLGVLELVGIDPAWPQPVGDVASALADELEDATGRLFVAWGQIGRLKSDLAEAVDHLEDLLIKARELGDVFITGAALLWLIAARATSDRRAALETMVELIDHWIPTGDRVQLLTGLAHVRLLLERLGLERAFELADGLVRARSSTSWHVVETEALLGRSARERAASEAGARARFASSEFEQIIRALREELVAAL